MNCPNCGAENEAEARFCAECGTPLEAQADTGSVIPVETPEDDSDRTLLSSYSNLMAEQAKTVSVTQDEVAAAVESEPRPSWPEPAPIPNLPPAPEVPSTPPPTGQGGGLFSQRNIIIAVIVLVVLCCCCAAIGIGVSMALGEGEFNFDVSLVPGYLALV